MKRIAIIPARGGSKRIPRKNIKEFYGQPIIAYSIRTLLDTKLFDKVFVSTDDEEIASISIKYGAEVTFLRSKKTSDDFAPLSEVLMEVIMEFEKMNENFDIICCMLPTAPLIESKHILEMDALISNNDFNSVISIQSFEYPILRALKRDENNHIEMIWPQYKNTRSQDLEEAFHDAGQVYFIKKDILLHEKVIFTSKATGYLLNKIESVDIDSLEDWKFAEALYEIKHQL